MCRPGSSLLLLESEKFSDLNFQNLCELFQAGDGWGVNATLHQADELNRAAERFRQLLLGELPSFAECSDALAEFSLKHGV